MIIRFVLLLISIISTACAEKTDSWPVISEFEYEYVFDDPSQAMVELDIKDQAGVPQYKFECHNYLYDSGSDFNYSGDFECRLESLYSNEYVSTLFAYSDDQSADWESRAIFYAAHFVGKCKTSPYGGKARVFRLRNMRIMLEIFDETTQLVEEDNRVTVQFEKFSFRVKTTKDNTAGRSIADDVGFDSLPEWFHKPHMCLNEVLEQKDKI